MRGTSWFWFFSALLWTSHYFWFPIDIFWWFLMIFSEFYVIFYGLEGGVHKIAEKIKTRRCHALKLSKIIKNINTKLPDTSRMSGALDTTSYLSQVPLPAGHTVISIDPLELKSYTAQDMSWCNCWRTCWRIWADSRNWHRFLVDVDFWLEPRYTFVDNFSRIAFPQISLFSELNYIAVRSFIFWPI